MVIYFLKIFIMKDEKSVTTKLKSDPVRLNQLQDTVSAQVGEHNHARLSS